MNPLNRRFLVSICPVEGITTAESPVSGEAAGPGSIGSLLIAGFGGRSRPWCDWVPPNRRCGGQWPRGRQPRPHSIADCQGAGCLDKGGRLRRVRGTGAGKPSSIALGSAVPGSAVEQVHQMWEFSRSRNRRRVPFLRASSHPPPETAGQKTPPRGSLVCFA